MSDMVDVVMPVYNAAPYLTKSIESILDQTFSDFRFIIIDDGSNDGSRDILQHYAKQDTRIVLLQNDVNSGICVSLNKGISYWQSKYIVRMDADDISHPDRIRIQLDFMEQHSDVGVCGCDMQCIDDKGDNVFVKKYPYTDYDIRKSLFLFNPISHPGSIIRRDVFVQTHGYDHDYILAEDLGLWFAIWSYAHFANIPQILIDYRVYTDNSTHTKFGSMISQAVKVRRHAISTYGYKPGVSWWLAIYISLIMQYIPVNLVHWLFYKLRSIIS